MKVERLNNLDGVPKGNYVGYVWLSDQKKPIVLTGQEFVKANFQSTNPFIVEGYLFDESEKRSVQIKHSGRLDIRLFHLDDNDFESGYLVEFLAHRLEGVSKLKFLEIWKSSADKFCLEMEVDECVAKVFVGFVNSKNHEI